MSLLGFYKLQIRKFNLLILKSHIEGYIQFRLYKLKKKVQNIMVCRFVNYKINGIRSYIYFFKGSIGCYDILKNFFSEIKYIIYDD